MTGPSAVSKTHQPKTNKHLPREEHNDINDVLTCPRIIIVIHDIHIEVVGAQGPLSPSIPPLSLPAYIDNEIVVLR